MRIAIGLVLLLQGCMGLGVQNMDAAQIRATEGMATCTDIQASYGRGRSVTVHADAARKGINVQNEIVIGPDCTVTIRGTTVFPNTQPVPTPAPLTPSQ